MAGHSVLDFEYDETFQVDGIPGNKVGHLDGFTVSNDITDQGIVSKRAGLLSCLKGVWTPAMGQMVTVRGLKLRVENVQDEDVCWTAVLIESHQ